MLVSQNLRIYFDTALSSSPAALPSMFAFAENSHVLYGSDFPYAPAHVGDAFNRKSANYRGLSVAQQEAVAHNNALRLFPRLAPMISTDTPAKHVQVAR